MSYDQWLSGRNAGWGDLPEPEDPREEEYQSELESVYNDLRAAQAEIKDLREYVARLQARLQAEILGIKHVA